MRVAGIDQGTTGTKALLVSEDGSSTLLGSRPHRQILPRSGWVEHDPLELLDSVRQLIHTAIAEGADAVALANQGETVIAWDKRTGRPLCNAIVWQDQRTAEAIERLRSDGHAARVTEATGLPLDSYFSASKLRWILDHVPEADDLRRSGHLGLGTTDSYFLHQLTGRYVTDVTTAARTSLMNLQTCSWDSDLCDLFGVPQGVLPEIVECDQPIGEVAGTAVGAAIVDQLAALYGHGCRAPGDIKVTFGTGAFALMMTSTRARVEGMVSTVGWSGPEGRVHAVDGAVYTAGAAVEWLIRIGLLESAAALDGLEGEPAASLGLCFVPALSGLAAPHWDRTAAGLWIGIDNATGREDLIKAVLEGVAFRMAEVLDVFDGLGEQQGLLSVDGGLARCRYFLQAFTDLAGRPIVVPDNPELTAYGAALLGGRGRISAAGVANTRLEPRHPPGVSAWREQFAQARSRAQRWRHR